MKGFTEGFQKAKDARLREDKWNKQSKMWDQDMELKEAREERAQERFGIGKALDEIKLEDTKRKAGLAKRRSDFQKLGGMAAMDQALEAMSKGQDPDPETLQKIARASKYDQNIEVQGLNEDGKLTFVSPKHGKSWQFGNTKDFLEQTAMTLQDPNKAMEEMYSLVQDAEQPNNYIDLDTQEVEQLTPYEAERDERNLISVDAYKAGLGLRKDEADISAQQALTAKRMREAQNVGAQDWEQVTGNDGSMYWAKPGTSERIEIGVDGKPAGGDQPAILQETDSIYQNLLKTKGLTEDDLDDSERAELWLESHTKASSKGQSDPREAGANFYKGIFNRLVQYGENPNQAEKMAQGMTDNFLKTYYNYQPPMSDARKKEIKSYMKKHLQKGDIPVSKLRQRALDLGLSERDLQELGISPKGQASKGGKGARSNSGLPSLQEPDLKTPSFNDWRAYQDLGGGQ
jgi:hypothetical protein